MGNKTTLKVSSEGKKKMMKHFDYTGDPKLFTKFLAADPAKQHLVNRYYNKAKKKYKMYQGGVIGYAKGTGQPEVSDSQQAAIDKLQQMGGTTKGSGGDYSNAESFKNYKFTNPDWQYEDLKATIEAAGAGDKNEIAGHLNTKHDSDAGSFQWDGSKGIADPIEKKPETIAKPTVNPIEQQMQNQATNPQLTGGQTVTPKKIDYDSDTQDIKEGTGKLDENDPQATVDTATKADDVVAPTTKDAEQYTADKSQDEVEKVTDALDPEQLDKDKIKKIEAEQQTKSSVSDLEAEQGKGIMMDDPKKRVLQDGELVESAVDAKGASEYAEELKAAQADPSKDATLAGQLEKYDKLIGDENNPLAKNMMRTLRDKLAAQGIQGSDLGQAMLQGMLEQQINMANIDAQTYAKFEGQNLSNRQQRVMLAAETRAKFMGQKFDQEFQSKVINASKVSDIANMNFTAEQQVALENSRIANTMNLQNLNNKQALVMAEAASLANLDMANLNNRQQAAVQNAQNFLAVDMANLNNAQQTSMFKAQASVNSILSDTAATNAAKQFNASSENQMTQFYDNLSTQVKQFNTAQTNAMSQFNSGQKNATSQFNTQIKNQRDQFNAQNAMVIAQSNVQWRRAIATGDTAAINRANELNAQNLVQMSQMAYQNIWQQYGDSMERAWRSSESELDRMTSIATTKMQIEGNAQIAEDQRNADSVSSIGGWLLDFIF
jgi:hypothetical protein